MRVRLLALWALSGQEQTFTDFLHLASPTWPSNGLTVTEFTHPGVVSAELNVPSSGWGRVLEAHSTSNLGAFLWFSSANLLISSLPHPIPIPPHHTLQTCCSALLSRILVMSLWLSSPPPFSRDFFFPCLHIIFPLCVSVPKFPRTPVSDIGSESSSL